MVVGEMKSKGHGKLNMGAKSGATDGFSTGNENIVGTSSGTAAGTAIETSPSSAGDGLRTYVRRKRRKVTTEPFRDGIVAVDSHNKLPIEVPKEQPKEGLDNSSSDQGSRERLGSDAFVNGSGCSLGHCRKLVLKQMYESLNESEGGLRECIQSALLTDDESRCTTAIKESLNCVEEARHFPAEHRLMVDGIHNAAKSHADVARNELLNESDNFKNTEMCKRVFFDVLTSKKFTELCDLLFRSFHDVKVDRILDVNVINSRMKDGAYERSPMLFLSDIEQIWTKLQKIGSDMVSLAKSLSDKSRTCCERVGCFAKSISEDGKNESEESEMLVERNVMPAGVTNGVYTCRACGKRADQRFCLVCDSCEGMYHLSCIKHALTEIPLKSWYCGNCIIINGTESPHENCIVCEKIKGAPVSQIVEQHEREDSETGLEAHAVGLMNGGKCLSRCRICLSEVKADQKFRKCGHRFCPNKHYHDRCLTIKQLGTYGPHWLCPSCLCRNCLTDKDDDKICLCDSCDQAYHIYCMSPPRNTIPKGKWYCVKCDRELKHLRKVKRAYEKIESTMKNSPRNDMKKAVERREDVSDKSGGVDITDTDDRSESLLDKPGGVDMLLTAAMTLCQEENLAALREERVIQLG